MTLETPSQDDSEPLASHQRDWDEMGALDPYWAILSDPAKRHGGWDVETFFRTGRVEIDGLMNKSTDLGLPRERGSALDFGCGVGRLTRALAGHFSSVTGLDISSLMIDEARRLSVDEPNCNYVLNESESLTMFEADRFDLIYSNIVLQHLPNARIVRGYLLEFVRILRPGGLIVFQIPSPFPPRHRLQLRPRAYGLLRRLRVAPRLAYRLGLHPIRMHGLHRDEVGNIMASAGARIVRVDSDPLDKWSVVDQVFFVTK